MKDVYMFCEKCGTPIKDGERFCMNCGTKVEADIFSTKNNTPVAEGGVLSCRECGSEIMENEKYCINCGIPTKNNTFGSAEEAEIGLQTELYKIFTSNKVMAFLLKIAIVLVLAYPIYTLIGRFDVFNSIYVFLSKFTIILYFAYNIGLFAAYTGKKFIGLFIALALRLLNSSILLFQSETPWPSLLRIFIIVVSAVFVYKNLMTDSQCNAVINPFKTTGINCTNCGCSMKSGDIFCPKCGNRM